MHAFIRISGLLFILILSVNLKAQSEKTFSKLQWGQELKEPNNTFLSKIITADENGFYTLREKSPKSDGEKANELYLEYFSKSGKLLKANEIELRYKKKKLELEDVLKVGGELYLLSSFNNQAKKKNYLFAQRIKTKTLTPEKKLINIGAIDTKNKFKEGSFNFHISRDSSKILVYNELPNKRKEAEKFSLRVFDNQFNEIWSKDIQLPYDNNRFSVEEYQIDNDGNVFLLGVVYEDGQRVRRKGKPTYRYTILSYSQNKEDSKEYKIDMDDQFLTDLTFRIANNGHLVCSGFYSGIGTYSIKGTYFFRLDPESGKLYNRNLKAFDFDFVTEYLPERKKKKLKDAEEEGKQKKGIELYQFALDHLILRNDGGALLIAEQYFVQEDYNRNPFYDPYYSSFYSNRNYNDLDYIYNYNDIIVVNIRPDGEIEWATRIPKRQVTTNDGGYYSSYAMSIVRSKIYFVFNDNGKNYDASNNRNRLYSYNGKKSIIALAELHRDGTVKTYPLDSNRDANIITRPKVCKQVGLREMIIYGELGRTFKFANLTFLNN